MLALGSEAPGLVVLEVLIWGVPLVLAIRLLRALPRDHRRTWLVVAAACAVIVLDKLVDLQMVAVTVGRGLVHRFAPELTSHGPDRWGRAALLATLLVLGCGALWALVRGDRHWSRPKATALLGLVGVMAFLGARLLPVFAGPLGGNGVGWAVELICCALVWTGILAARTPDGT